MKVLVANLGSTSFKYRLFDMENESQLARGSVERIGAAMSRCAVQIGDYKAELDMPVPNHGVAVQACLQQLTDPANGCLEDAGEVAAIGFKAVHGGHLSGVFRIDDSVLAAMDTMTPVAPAHNPPYLAAMRQLAAAVPHIPLVAAFETDFHQTIPESQKRYAIPKAWADALPLRRWGFHGASHRFIAQRSAQLMGRSDARVISCHLGGSSSLCAIHAGKSVGTTMGMSPQTGLPQNNRVGDFDPFALPLLMQLTGKDLPGVLKDLATQGGLLGLSGGLSGDIRDLESAASQGNGDAQLALDVYIAEIRRHLGGMLMLLGGADAIVFTGGIGENGRNVRQRVCENAIDLGIQLDADKNAQGKGEYRIDAPGSRVQLWVIPTNEELVVARQTMNVVKG